MFADPLQMDVGDIETLEAAAAEQEVNNATFGAMIKRFDGQAGAFAYLLFVLLHFPCVAVIDAVRGMLDVWIRKGKVEKSHATASRGTSCQSCDPAATEVYLWFERSTDKTVNISVPSNCDHS